MSLEPRIDIHTHAFPRSFLEYLAKTVDDVVLREHSDGRLIAFWNKAPLPELWVDERLDSMDREGVTTEVLSAPPVYGHFDASTASLCTMMNELQAELSDRAPGRFYGYLHLPYHDRLASERELARFADDPRFVGVTIASNMNGQYPGPELDWLWSTLCDTRLPVFVHPVAPVGVQSPMSLPLVHFPSDTTVCASQMILSGVMQRFPALRVILAHYGGSLSVLGSRLDMITHPHFPPHPGSDLPGLPSSYVRRFYVDAAQGFHDASYGAAMAAFGPGHLLYGSDYFLLDTPWRHQLNQFLEARLDQPLVREAVLRDNALNLLRFPQPAAALSNQVTL